MTVQVAVCGPRSCTAEDEQNAHRGGQLLAEHGTVIIYGGDTEVMAAVAAGARSRGGIIISSADAVTAELGRLKSSSVPVLFRFQHRSMWAPGLGRLGTTLVAMG